MKTAITVVTLLFGSMACAHAGHHHGEHTNVAKTLEAPPDLKRTYEDINRDYAALVKPIFDKKCADCHSSDVAAPWYARLPILNSRIESDRSEAKEHLEISKGFPFGGHGTPKEDLDAIAEDVSKGSMPPGLYSFAHPFSKLSDDEKKTVLNWVDNSSKKLMLNPM